MQHYGSEPPCFGANVGFTDPLTGLPRDVLSDDLLKLPVWLQGVVARIGLAKVSREYTHEWCAAQSLRCNNIEFCGRKHTGSIMIDKKYAPSRGSEWGYGQPHAEVSSNIIVSHVRGLFEDSDEPHVVCRVGSSCTVILAESAVACITASAFDHVCHSEGLVVNYEVEMISTKEGPLATKIPDFSFASIDVERDKTAPVIRVELCYYHKHAGGMMSRNRQFSAPVLSEILDVNYTESVASAARRLLDEIRDRDRRGRIIVFEGPPGSGKSYLIKSIARELQDDVSTVIVLNPIKYFACVDDYVSGAGINTRLLMFEDAEELLNPELRRIDPEVFSVLANVTSGALDGLTNDLLLFTSNRKVDTLDAALTRSGRMLAHIKVDKLDKPAMRRFCTAHGINDVPTEPLLLAEMYDLVRKSKIVEAPSKKALGFA